MRAWYLIQGQLDLEAIDVAFIQPLKDLHAWWERQSSATKAYINLLTPLIGTGLVAFLAKVMKPHCKTLQAITTIRHLQCSCGSKWIE